MENDEKPISVIPVMDNDRFVNEFRQFLVLWNKLEHVERVMENEKKLQKNVVIVMQLEKSEKK